MPGESRRDGEQGCVLGWEPQGMGKRSWDLAVPSLGSTAQVIQVFHALFWRFGMQDEALQCQPTFLAEPLVLCSFIRATQGWNPGGPEGITHPGLPGAFSTFPGCPVLCSQRENTSVLSQRGLAGDAELSRVVLGLNC